MMRPQNLVRSALPVIAALAALLAAACGGPQYPNCNDDSNCHEGEYCVNGTCQQCRPGGDDCPSGQECNDGRCDAIPGWCGSSSDCPAGQECQGNRCVQSQVTEGEPIDSGPAACGLDAIYFAYDASEISGTARSTLETNASCINSRDIPHVRVTGHTDPRGTEEYNLALGERRAQSVRTYMTRLGVDSGRMSTHSMGEEVARGSDESSWSQDRRVQFEER